MNEANVVKITSAAQLRALVGEPAPKVIAKERPQLLEIHRAWLRHSPFVMVATAGDDGTCDVSPKGDPAGFVHVLDDTTIALPDRPGNRRVDGFSNVIANPHVGLCFFIPGRGDTLRINGRAHLLAAAPFFDEMVVEGHRPTIALVVEIEQVFFHCPKAFGRARLWEAEAWQPGAAPSRALVAHTLERPHDSVAAIEADYAARAGELYV